MVAAERCKFVMVNVCEISFSCSFIYFIFSCCCKMRPYEHGTYDIFFRMFRADPESVRIVTVQAVREVVLDEEKVALLAEGVPEKIEGVLDLDPNHAPDINQKLFKVRSDSLCLLWRRELMWLKCKIQWFPCSSIYLRIYIEILEVNLHAFAYRRFREDFTPFDGPRISVYKSPRWALDQVWFQNKSELHLRIYYSDWYQS